MTQCLVLCIQLDIIYVEELADHCSISGLVFEVTLGDDLAEGIQASAEQQAVADRASPFLYAGLDTNLGIIYSS